MGDGNLFPSGNRKSGPLNQGLLPFPTAVDDDRIQAIDKFLFKPGPYLDPPDPASTAASHASTSEAASSAPASAPHASQPVSSSLCGWLLALRVRQQVVVLLRACSISHRE